jgi:tetratricopeptide (TPR) repeat protein
MRFLARAPAFICAVSLFVATTEVSAAPARDPQAQKFLEKGRAAYGAENYEKADEWFAKAYEIEPTPELLYARAQSKRLGGHCEEAVPLYSEFLSTNPGGDLAQLAKEAKNVCADELAAAAAAAGEEEAEEEEIEESPEPEPPPPPVVDEGKDAPKDRDPGTRRWYQDPLGGALVGAGVAGVGAGVGLLVAAQIEHSKGSSNYGDFADRRDRVRNFRIAGGVVLGVGVALLIGGATRWGLLARKEKKGATAGIMLDRSTAGLTLSGRF